MSPCVFFLLKDVNKHNQCFPLILSLLCLGHSHVNSILGVCTTDVPTAVPSQPATWNCLACTFINLSSQTSCKACGTPQVTTPPTIHHAFSPPSAISQPYPHGSSQVPSSPHAGHKTFRVKVPPGMKPGQKVKVSTGPTTSDAVVVIPPRHAWSNNDHSNGRWEPSTFEVTVTMGDNQENIYQSPNATNHTYTHHSPNHTANHTNHTYTNHSTNHTSHIPNRINNSYHHIPERFHDGRYGSGDVPWMPFHQFQSQKYKPPPTKMISTPLTSNHSPINASGRRKALLIGINYTNTRASLRGCVNDAMKIKGLLVENGFTDDAAHMTLLIDETPEPHAGGGGAVSSYLPTKANIVKGLQWLVSGSRKGDVLFFHFSGHGAQVPDATGQEADGLNETILPLDYQKAGMISDDTIWGSMVYPLAEGVRLTALMDCCHSGTGLDLPFECQLKRNLSSVNNTDYQWVEDINPAHSRGDVVLLSGCEDAQTSADAFDRHRKEAGGAMTTAFIDAYRAHPAGSTYPEILNSISEQLRRKNFAQRPQLTTSQRFDVRRRIFSLVEGIEPNGNAQIGRLKRRHFKPAKNVTAIDPRLNELLFGGALAIGLASILFD